MPLWLKAWNAIYFFSLQITNLSEQMNPICLPFPFAEYNLHLIPYDNNSLLPFQHSCAVFIRVYLYCVQFIKLIHYYKRVKLWERNESFQNAIIFHIHVWVVRPFIYLDESIFIVVINILWDTKVRWFALFF